MEAVVNPPQGPRTESFRNVGSMLRGQMSVEGLLAGLNARVVVISRTPLPRLQGLHGDLVLGCRSVHRTSIPPTAPARIVL